MQSLLIYAVVAYGNNIRNNEALIQQKKLLELCVKKQGIIRADRYLKL